MTHMLNRRPPYITVYIYTHTVLTIVQSLHGAAWTGEQCGDRTINFRVVHPPILFALRFDKPATALGGHDGVGLEDTSHRHWVGTGGPRRPDTPRETEISETDKIPPPSDYSAVRPSPTDYYAAIE